MLKLGSVLINKEDREMFIKTLDAYINDPRIQNLPRKNLLQM